jgi:hypothetical protein
MSSLRPMLLIFLFATTLGAKELAIVGGGRRIVDLDPSSAESNCGGWSYDPMPVRDDAGELSILYSTGDALTNHCTGPIESPSRFGDHIWRHTRQADGTWSGAPVITRADLDWMSSPSVDDFVGHLASPAVVRADGRYYMAFVAGVNDPNLCAGEHDALNACGPCSAPWSYFTMLWAVSDDGVKWTIRKRDATASNRALGASTLWRDPTASDRGAGSLYKGLTRVSMVRDDKYFYLMTQFWSQPTVKVALFRIAADPSSPFGISSDPEIWHTQFNLGNAWEACPSGRVPDWLDQQNGTSIPSLGTPIASIATTTAFPGYRYIALLVGSGSTFVINGGRANRIDYQLSNDLINWIGAPIMRSEIPHFADTFSYDNSVIGPVIAEDGAGKMNVYFASGDGDEDHGIARDGVRDCTSGAGPTTVFVGSGIYEGIADMITLTPTTTTIETPVNPVNTGFITFTVHVSSELGKPNGRVSLEGNSFFAQTRVVDGVATLTASARFTGTFPVSARFDTDAGPWAPSSSSQIVVHVTNPPPRRRAARH